MQFSDNITNDSYCHIFILFLLLILASYSNSFHADWQLDDKPNILKNAPVQLEELSWQNISKAAFAKPGSGQLYRPVVCISLALNWFFGKDNVFGYHVVNFLVHFFTAWLLFLTIRLLFLTPRLREKYTDAQIIFIAVVSTLFWALNPVQVQAVTYIIQRMASMAALFSILFLYFYIKARLETDERHRSICFLLATLGYILAVMSKENAAFVILLLPVFELIFFNHELTRAHAYKVIGFVFLGGLICLLAAFALRPGMFDYILNYYQNRPFTLSERLLTEQRIVLFYLSQLFFPAPWRLSTGHDIELSTSLFSPITTIAAVIFHLLMVILAVKVYKKQPLTSIAILFFYLNHLVESTILPLELIFEHRNYLPSLFLFLPVAQLFNFILHRYKNKFFTVVFIIALGCLFALEGYATYIRNKAWETEITLNLDAHAKAPNYSRPLSTLAIKLAWGPNPTEKKYRKALELTERTLSMRMSRKLHRAAQLGNMASIYTKLGEFKKADEYYKMALNLAKNDASIRYNFCKNHIMLGDFAEAKKELAKIFEKGLIHADYSKMSGFLDIKTGNPQQALPVLRQAMEFAPNRPDIMLVVGKCFSMMGYYKKANWFYFRARQNKGDERFLSLSLMENALKEKNFALAEKEFERALKHISLPSLLYPLKAPQWEKNMEIPLDYDMLLSFIRSELKDSLDSI